MGAVCLDSWDFTIPFQLDKFLAELERRTGLNPRIEQIRGFDSIGIPIDNTNDAFFVLCFDSVKKYFECSFNKSFIEILFSVSARDRYCHHQVKQTLRSMEFPFRHDSYKGGMKRGEVEDVYWFYHHPPKWTNKKWEEIRWWEFVKP